MIRAAHVLMFSIPLLIAAQAVTHAQQLPAPAASNRAAVARQYGNLPLSFEANQGQTDPSVRFLSRGSGYSLYLTDSTATLALGTGQSAETVVRMNLLGTAPRLTPRGESTLPGKVNYFLGSDPAQWHADLPTYAKVRYAGVYPGIDLVYYGNQQGNQRNLEYDFIVAPGVRPDAIRLGFDGAKHLRIAANGDLILKAGESAASFQKPVVYQESEGRRQPVAGRYRLAANHTVTFAIGRYDHKRPLIIDPVLVYSTYLGGMGNSTEIGLPADVQIGDEANGVAVDKDGNAYLVGVTTVPDFPVTAGSYQNQNNVFYQHRAATTGFIAKLNRTGTALLYSTYLGGYGNIVVFPATGYILAVGDFGFSIALDSANNAYVTGTTFSPDFPTTAGALQTVNFSAAHQTPTAFVTKLNADGNALIYSTYLGGTNHLTNQFYGPIYGDVGQGIAVDDTGSAYVTGYTAAADFPVTAGALQTGNAAVANDTTNAFVSKLNPTGTALAYSTYLGGSGLSYGEKVSLAPACGDAANSIAVDSHGNTYVTGATCSADFPVTPGSFQTVSGSAQYQNPSAFVTKLNSTGTEATYSTYFGGDNPVIANAIAIDSTGSAYIAGTGSSQPVTAVTYPSSVYQGSGAFLAKFNASGSALTWSTALPAGTNSATGLAIDGAGYAYVTGSAYEAQFPSTTDAVLAYDLDPNNSTNTYNPNYAYLVKMNPSASAVAYATLLGDTTYQKKTVSTALALGSNGNVYVTGSTSADSFITTAGVVQPVNNAYEGGANAFLTALSLGGETTSHLPALIDLSASGQFFNPGQSITLTATVTPATGSIRPTGTVTFYGSIPSTNATLNSNGVATLTLSSLAPGIYTVYAIYNGDAKHLTAAQNLYGQTLPVTFRAVGPPASLTLGANGSSAVYGKSFPAVIAQVFDATGYALNGINVAFSGSPGLSLSTTASQTGIDGVAYTQPTATKVGAYSVIASVSGLSLHPSVRLNLLPANLLVTVNPPGARLYGDPNPTFTNTITGLVGSDTVTVIDTTTATTASPVGYYPVTATVSGAALSNYAVVSVPAQLNVHARLLTLTAVSYKSTYGEAPAAPTAYNFTGFANGETASVVSGAPVLSTTVTAKSPVGNYPIQIGLGTLAAANYTFARDQTKGFVQVQPALLTLAANNLSMKQGAAVPALTYSLAGFVNGDSASVVTGTPTLTTTATPTSKPGQYPITITVGTLKATNYAFTKINGVLTVTP